MDRSGMCQVRINTRAPSSRLALVDQLDFGVQEYPAGHNFFSDRPSASWRRLKRQRRRRLEQRRKPRRAGGRNSRTPFWCQHCLRILIDLCVHDAILTQLLTSASSRLGRHVAVCVFCCVARNYHTLTTNASASATRPHASSAKAARTRGSNVCTYVHLPPTSPKPPM